MNVRAAFFMAGISGKLKSMFGLFGNNKKKAAQKSVKKPAKGKKAPASKAGNGAKPSREELLAQAKANAARARESIGEETLDRVAEMLEKKKKNAAIEKARAQISEMDQDRVADTVRSWIDEDRNK